MIRSLLLRRDVLTSIALASSLLALGADAPRPDPAFGNHLLRAQRSYDAGLRLAALDALQDANRLLQDDLHDLLEATMPRAPQGYRIDVPAAAPPGGARPADQGPGANFAPPFTATGPRPVERRYRQVGGPGLLRVQLAPRSSQVAATQHMFTTTEQRKGHELLEIGEHLVLKMQGTGRTLYRVVLDDAHLFEVQSYGTDEDIALALFGGDTLPQIAALLR